MALTCLQDLDFKSFKHGLRRWKLQFPPGWLPKNTGGLAWQHGAFPIRWDTWVRCLLIEEYWNHLLPGTNPLQVTCQKFEQLKSMRLQVMWDWWNYLLAFQKLTCTWVLPSFGDIHPKSCRKWPPGELEDGAKEQGVLPAELDVHGAFKSVNELKNCLKNWFALNQINLKLSILVNDSLSFNLKVLRLKKAAFLLGISCVLLTSGF